MKKVIEVAFQYTDFDESSNRLYTTYSFETYSHKSIFYGLMLFIELLIYFLLASLCLYLTCISSAVFSLFLLLIFIIYPISIIFIIHPIFTKINEEYAFHKLRNKINERTEYWQMYSADAEDKANI